MVDDFIDRLWVNEVLNANPKSKEAMGIFEPALKYLATELVCMVNRPTTKVHRTWNKRSNEGLNISEKE